MLTLRTGLGLGAVVVVAAGAAGYLTKPSGDGFTLPQAGAPEQAKVTIIVPAKSSSLPALAPAPETAATSSQATNTTAGADTSTGANTTSTTSNNGGGSDRSAKSGGDDTPTPVGGAD